MPTRGSGEAHRHDGGYRPPPGTPPPGVRPAAGVPAAASSATVRLREEAGKLSVEVVDNGRGFDVRTIIRGDVLTNMENRLDALGGSLALSTSPGDGTTLRAILPVLRSAPVAS